MAGNGRETIMGGISSIEALVLEGSPRKRGQVHGEALRSAILEFEIQWKDHLGASTGMKPSGYIEQFLERTNPLPAISMWTPYLLEEVRGISEGSGVDFPTVLALQLADEEWLFRREQGLTVLDRSSEHCSVLGVALSHGTPPLLAQNLDLTPFYDGFQVLLRIKDPISTIESYVASVPGLIALNGLNNRSIAICVNMLDQLDHRWDGLPLAFVIRGVLDQPSLSDATRFVSDVMHASGQNYMLAGPEGIRSFECSANQVRELAPESEIGRFCHTNHPLVNDDQAKYREWYSGLTDMEVQLEMDNLVDSEIRLDYMQTQLDTSSELITVNRVKAILGSHDSVEYPVCRHRSSGDRLVSAFSTIMVLSTPPTLHLSYGPPCSAQYRVFSFQDIP
jgi:hypothetical protein